MEKAHPSDPLPAIVPSFCPPGTDLTATLSLLPDVRVRGHMRSLPSAVTTEWKVRWSADQVARDLMQNFHDANDGLSTVNVSDLSSGVVVVSAAAEFQVARLYFLGSEKSKSAGDIGGFGEGWKAACVALVRDFNVEPICISGNAGVRVRSGPVVPGTDLRPLQYDFFEVVNSRGGTHLILAAAPLELVAAMLRSKDHFFDRAMSSIAGPPLQATQAVELYACARPDGLGFYQGQLCCRFDGVPIVLHLRSPDRFLETRVASDRDRREFKDGALHRFLTASANALGRDGAIHILKAASALWGSGRGSPLLSALAGRFRASWVAHARTMLPPPFWLLYVGNDFEYGRAAEIAQQWRREGGVRVPHYFARFGVRDVTDLISREEHAKAAAREASQADAAARARRIEAEWLAQKDAVRKVPNPPALVKAKKTARDKTEQTHRARRQWLRTLTDQQISRLSVIGSLFAYLRRELGDPLRNDGVVFVPVKDSTNPPPRLGRRKPRWSENHEVLVGKQVLCGTFANAVRWALDLHGELASSKKAASEPWSHPVARESTRPLFDPLDHVNALARYAALWNSDAASRTLATKRHLHEASTSALLSSRADSLDLVMLAVPDN